MHEADRTASTQSTWQLNQLVSNVSLIACIISTFKIISEYNAIFPPLKRLEEIHVA